MSFYRKARFPGWLDVVTIVRDETESRLQGTCFRSKEKPLAGNFSYWERVRALFDDPIVYGEFLEEIVSISLREEFIGGHSVTLTYPLSVGWASTAPSASFSSNEIEDFYPSRRSSGLRVKTTSLRLAPRTNDITFVFDLKLESQKKGVVFVNSIYPGPDVGELFGDVSERERVVFFGWSHPGA